MPTTQTKQKPPARFSLNHLLTRTRFEPKSGEDIEYENGGLSLPILLADTQSCQKLMRVIGREPERDVGVFAA